MKSYNLKGKKGLGVGQVFIFIVAAITFSLIMIFGYRAILQFLQQGERVQFYQFKTDLENSIKRIYTEYGSVRIEKFQAPPVHQQICFVDLDAPYNGQLCSYNAIACNIWQEAQEQGGYEAMDENVFLKPPATVKIKVHRIKMDEGFLCLTPREGLFELVLEGRGDHTFLSSTAS